VTRSTPSAPGPHRSPPSTIGIRADELLPIRALHERLGWGPRTVAKAQRDGLRVIRYAKWAYVRGADVIAFLGDQAHVPAKETT
jgi:hypothetical protein